jgi:hypothetical protein
VNTNKHRQMYRNIEERINAEIAGEQKSQEPRLKLWKNRPRQVKREMSPRVFQILQKQHNLKEDDS